ncbi:MAG: exonuclease [Candidatus Brockarchaeota archaeon]|nr:exonuclease [Candidatus Brockarchaeota archaeon]
MAKVSAGNGMEIDLGGVRIGLDDHDGEGVDYVFVSHAHGDHLRKADKNLQAICSEETAMLAAARGVDLRIASVPGIELFPSGHILGSMALRVGRSVLYTGDVCDRSRGPIEGFNPPKAETIIIESTFGFAAFRFPKLDDVLGVARDCIDDCFRKGVPVVAMGYALGKAQQLEFLLDEFRPSYVHPLLTKYDEIYRLFGIRIRERVRADEALKTNLLEKKPWILFAPFQSGRSSFNSYVRKRYGARLMAFSGWACERGYKEAMGVDEAFPLSDHCDFDGLLRTVKRSRADKVFTTHGFSGEFAKHLRKIGYDARPLPGGQETLQRYLKES